MHVNGEAVAPAGAPPAVAPAASSHEVCRWSMVPAADPAVAVPPGLTTQPPQPPPPPQRPPTIDVISVMRTMQSQLATLEAQIEGADEVMQTMAARLAAMEAASAYKDEYVKTIEKRLDAMEAMAQTKAHEEADVPWGEKVGITDDENPTTWPE